MSERITITMPSLAEPDPKNLRQAIDKARRNASLTECEGFDRAAALAASPTAPERDPAPVASK